MQNNASDMIMLTQRSYTQTTNVPLGGMPLAFTAGSPLSDR